MEKSEHNLIQKLQESNVELKRLYDQHIALENKLSIFAKKIYLTPEEQTKEKTLKAEKLQGVDRMLRITNSKQQAA